MKIKVSDIAEGKLSVEEVSALQQYFREGGTWHELLELKPEQVEEVYAVGYDLYQKKEYDKAISAFSALIQLNPYEVKHWIAMGAALQAQSNYKEALVAYSIALSLDENHLGALFYSAQCSYALEQREEGIAFLQKIVDEAEKNQTQTPFAENARRILASEKRGQ